MPAGANPPKSAEAAADGHVALVRGAFAAALRGDFDALGRVLAEDVRWHGAGAEEDGCQNRREAVAWMRETVARGVRAEVLDVRALDADRVLVVLQRNQRRRGDPPGDLPPPHGQIVTFRDGQVSEIVVYPSDDDAFEAARNL